MALSFEESKKQALKQAAAPMLMSVSNEVIIDSDNNWKKPENASNYEYYNNEYHDDDLSTVDGNKKITLSTNQINLTQEKNSQYIPFEIPRYYDGFDLSKTALSIYWVNESGSGSVSVPVDVYYNESKIRFAWLVDNDVTARAGKIKFEIQASGTNSKGYEYLWKTKSNDGISVVQALEIKSFIEPDDTWQETFVAKVSAQADRAEVASNKAEAAAVAAEKAASDLQDGIADEVKTALGDNYYTKSEVDGRLENVQVDLTGYATETYVDEKLQQ